VSSGTSSVITIFRVSCLELAGHPIHSAFCAAWVGDHRSQPPAPRVHPFSRQGERENSPWVEAAPVDETLGQRPAIHPAVP